MPKHFKFIVPSDEEIMIFGGYDQLQRRSSKEAYLINQNKL